MPHREGPYGRSMARGVHVADTVRLYDENRIAERGVSLLAASGHAKRRVQARMPRDDLRLDRRECVGVGQR